MKHELKQLQIEKASIADDEHIEIIKIMTPQEKANELVRKYYTWGINKEGQTLSWLESKQCALIAVDQLVNESSEKIHRSGKCYLSDREF